MANSARTSNAQAISLGHEPNLWSEYEIETAISLVDRPLRNLKHGDAFAVLDSYGDVGAVKDTAEGLFYRDTRYLSHYELRIEGKRPHLLSSVMHEDKAALSVDLTNSDVPSVERRMLRDTIFIGRTKFLWNAVCYERITLRNYDRAPRRFFLDILFDADFADLFEVRGTTRARRGRRTTKADKRDQVEFHYQGLDGIERRTVLKFSPEPLNVEVGRATFDVALEPGEQTSLFVNVSSEENTANEVGDFFRGYREMRRARRSSTARIATVRSSNDLFNEVVCRATSDVYTLVTRSELGPYPYAGIPWFSTIFGRDGIITAMLMLWIDPSIAAGVLRTLAATQATSTDRKSDAQPGKIMHETRNGEMANLGEVPFRRYYGTVDATPLFVMLAGMYFHRTGDEQLIRELWPNIEAALGWIDTSGDCDGDGFVEYFRETESGLANQGWKDSHDAIFHSDGSNAEGPIALCEVQGYVYAAKRAAAVMALRLGRGELAGRLDGEAERLQAQFEQAFWCPEIGTYALALDGAKRPCRVRASNAGHALFTGIADPERARQTADTLMNPESFSGWGIRTVPSGEARYNPMSYHNGSIWPHDNALIALGFARYGFKSEAARLFEGLFSAATHQESRRLPELFCGFIRRPHRGPTAYPVACSPQAWAAATSFGLLAACIGLDLAHDRDQICLQNPVAPEFLDEVVIRNLRLGTSRMDLRLHRYGRDMTANILSREGTAGLVLSK
ncbi:MAG: Amylo-alpha6-glucosidase [Enterovirga sp.]|jgi:glycogen debranching enzyme|nr:Amylo-alpha6-glucosidase [Enterovirga sp.]